MSGHDPERAPRRRRRTLLLAGLGVVALLVVAALLGAGLLAGGGHADTPADPAPTSTSTPTSTTPAAPTATPTPDAAAPDVEAVADDFTDAVLAIDCPTVERLSTAAYLRRQGRCDATVPDKALAGATYTRRPAAVAGASATVQVVITPPTDGDRSAPTYRFTLTLVNTSLGWRVNDLATAS